MAVRLLRMRSEDKRTLGLECQHSSITRHIDEKYVLLSALQESGISGLILSVETTFLISSKLGSGVTY